MQEIQAQDQGRAGSKDSAGVIYFASQVVSLLAERNWRTFSELREPVVSGLITAALSGKKDAFADLLRELKKARVSAAALADLYIPEAARRMGDAWTDDQMSWLDVSIGVGRLQSLLREIGMAWVADQAGDTGHGTVLLIVPDREQHTLGPMVAMGQMRRYGVSVCLRIAPSHNELRSLMVARQFDGVLISIATKDKLESVSNTVQFIKAVAGKPMPIVVGGAVTPKVEDLAAATGADLASNDICEALESLGLEFDGSCVLRRA